MASASAYDLALADAGIQDFIVLFLDATVAETVRLLTSDVAPRVKPGRSFPTSESD